MSPFFIDKNKSETDQTHFLFINKELFINLAVNNIHKKCL